jgi:outer membrane lipoprotein-sorting protein
MPSGLKGDPDMDKNKIDTRGAKGLSVLLCLFWLTPSLYAQTNLNQVFAKMDEAAKGFKSVECNLERTKVTVLVNDNFVASGKLYYTRAGKEPRLKVELGKPPAQQIVLIDKGNLQVFTPKINEVQEAALGGHANAVEQFMALGFGQSSQDLKKNYQVSFAGEETIDGKKTAILDLTPPAPLAGVKTLRMWMDEQKGISVQVKATETSGDYTLFKYSNIKMNAGVPDSVFELRLPKDVHHSKIR